MSKPKKFLIVLIATPVLLLLLAVIGLLIFANSAARSGIERGATYALGVPTTLGSASVGIVSGKFGLSELRVANPSGYKADRFLSLGDGKVAVTLGSLMKDTIDVPTFTLDSIEVNLEKKDGRANYQVIMDNLAKLSKAPQPTGKPVEQGGGKKFIIQDLTIRNVIVRADLVGAPGAVGGVLNKAAAVTIPIDEIRLQNVGKGAGKGVADSGVTIGQLASIVVQAVLAAAAERGGGVLPADMLGDLQGGLAQLGGLKDVGVQVVGKAGEAVQQIGKSVQGAAQEQAKELKKIGEGLGEGLKKVLPGGK